MRFVYNVDKSALKGHGIYRIDFGGYSFYIGKADKQTFGERWSGHKYSFKKGTCNHLIWDLLLEDPNVTITFSIIRFLTYDIPAWESYYINYLLKPDLNVQHPKISWDHLL